MRNLIMSIVLLFLTTSFALTQNRFRRDYTNYSVVAPENLEVQGEYRQRNIFVFRYNENEDVLHIRPNGSKVVYVKMSDYYDSGSGEPEYKFFEALDEYGETIVIQIYFEVEGGIVLYSQKGGREDYDTIHFHNKDYGDEK